MKRIVFILMLASVARAQSVRQVELTHFFLQSTAVTDPSGAALTTPGYAEDRYWFPVTVPSTVLTGLVANNVYPDPYQGMNNMRIPDANDTFNVQYHLDQYSHLPGQPNPWKKPYWYRTSFTVPPTDKGRHFELVFKGINYRAEVWLNGRQIADTARMVGMFGGYNFDVSDAIRDTNILAVKIFPLDNPGMPAPPQLKALGDFFLNGGPYGDIGQNVTMLCSIGWDWIPEVHDRNMGIWQPVYLRTSGQVTIGQPHVVTSFTDTTSARVAVQLQLHNYGGAASGAVSVSLTPETFSGPSLRLERAVSVGSHATLDLDLGALTVAHPHLWWPNGYGRPDLYRMRIQYRVNGHISDDTSFLVGIRTVGSRTVDVDGWVRRDFYVNGRRVHLVGGAWVPDMMLNRDSARYDYELHLCRNANVNLVRIWGGGIGETDDFYTLADRYGLLVWQDFWITGDTQGEFKGSPAWPFQTRVFVHDLLSTILRIRNHPSLLVWTGGNEGHARLELYNAMRDNVAMLDGTRPFIPSSSGFAKQTRDFKGSWPDDKPSGVYSGGSYRYRDAATYYALVDSGKDWVFKDETGLPSQPPYNTLAKVIPDLVPDTSLPFPLNNTWGYHDACEGAARYSEYYATMAARYGTPTGMRDFSTKMQFLNADGYRGIFEAAGHHLNTTGGVMLWKLNSAFPSVVWQIYDWYLEPNAGYYFMQRACEPVHVQLNLDDTVVAVVNRTYIRRPGLTLRADVRALDGRLVYHRAATVSLDTTDVREVLPLASILSSTPGVSFVCLSLDDASGHPLSRNVYWFQRDKDFTGLSSMPRATVTTSLISSRKTAREYTYTLRFTNPSRGLAFFLNPQVVAGALSSPDAPRDEVMPSFWSDNYFSLEPGESSTLTVSVPIGKARGVLSVVVDGWNASAAALALPKP
ncbi:MAG TPA: glycoside hydrolase family 2 TIM barrel-domain containing protein [Dinghuibacter sp.]|uniref:glycoside hydrolase family 2 protein n=1 Tax=Dinghuibacter sp. TaxID=2024697 RepID=UPI002C50D4EA|nr:glycoside hydrolase family 2 TIM barrel-domain containing protein [Dinghuibacter sp.]HTJ11728.1 glycoside hydrolase family 2 TIM barrel-domain containing protein [Dinghuibacter sp.]